MQLQQAHSRGRLAAEVSRRRSQLWDSYDGVNRDNVTSRSTSLTRRGGAFKGVPGNPGAPTAEVFVHTRASAEDDESTPLAPSVLNRLYAQTSNTNNGAAGKDIGATSGDKLAEVRLDTKCLKTQVSVVTPVTQLRSKTSDLNATKPLALETSTLRTDATLAVGLALVKPNLRMRRVGGSEVVEPTEVAPATGLAQRQTKDEIEILRLFKGSTWPHDDTNDIGLTLDNCDPRQGVHTERHPELATITINHVLMILK